MRSNLGVGAGQRLCSLIQREPERKIISSSVIIRAKNQAQVEADMELGDWDTPDEVWATLEEHTRPEEEYTTWFSKHNYNRCFSVTEFHDETAALP
jgi:hypothetical protein